MSAPLEVAECRSCGHVAYPPRILCPVCAGAEWGSRPVSTGVVTEMTVRSPVFASSDPAAGTVPEQGTKLVAVRSDVGVRVIARAADGVDVGDEVRLVISADAAGIPERHAVEARRIDGSG